MKAAVRRGFRAWALALVVALAAAAPAGADFEAGQRAWDAGRHAEAVAAWQAAAEAGDGRAMLALGRAWAKGLGAPQDFVEAHKWLNLAAGLGSVEAAAERDALAGEMTAEERAEARKLARAWRNRERQAASRPASREAPAAEAPAGPPPKRALREAQGLLAALGYEPGPADGVWGRRSVEAYRGFLRDAGLDAADTLTPAALQAMRGTAGERNVRPARQAPARPRANLHRLVQAGDVDGLKAALAGGGARNIDARDGRGWTALMHAADKGYALLVPPLLKAGAKVDVRAPDGATALFMAAVHGHSEIIALLMNAGADYSIQGPKDRTAADVARVRYGGLDEAQRNNERSEVLALIEEGEPSTSEISMFVRKKKQSIEMKLASCSEIVSNPNVTDIRIDVMSAKFSQSKLEVILSTSDPSTDSNPGDTFQFFYNLDITNVTTGTKYGEFWYKGHNSHQIIFKGPFSSGNSSTDEVKTFTNSSFHIACRKGTTDLIVEEISDLQRLLQS